jgi:hypothetical protein
MWDYEAYDSGDRLAERHAGRQLTVGWDRQSAVIERGCVPVALGGRDVFLSPDQLTRLTGKTLVVEIEAVGSPMPSTVRRPILGAR